MFIGSRKVEKIKLAYIEKQTNLLKKLVHRIPRSQRIYSSKPILKIPFPSVSIPVGVK